ncbi:MAG: hypothetical protein CMP48_09225 [Rickettsiales bacterium]|nr:hypothetical protein [Rickettsiales bacterium]
MKLHFLIFLLPLVYGCNSNNQTVVTDSKVKVPTTYQQATPKEYLPITTTIYQLDADTSFSTKGDFKGEYVVADKYRIEVNLDRGLAKVNWQGFEQVLYKNENCSFKNLICYSSANPDFGKFFMNTRNGKLIHQIVEDKDTLYYIVDRLNKKNQPIGDFDGTYSIISPSADSIKFIMKATSPYKYEYQLDSGSKSTVYYRGRDKVGLMHYSNSITMNSDHLSGLYKWQDDSNSTIVKIN